MNSNPSRYTDPSSRRRWRRLSQRAVALVTAAVMTGALVGVSSAHAVTAVSKPLISVGPDMVVGEGDGFVDVPVTLSAPGTTAVSVRLLTVQGTAHQSGQPGPDYVATDVTMTFAPGETAKTVRINLVDDVDVEPLQSFTAELGNVVTGTLARGLARIDIVDNDRPVVSHGLFVRDLLVDESAGTVDVPVILGGPLGEASATPITVGFTTADGTAVAGSDYTTTSGTLTFAPGETVKNVPVVITNDTTAEGSERFKLTLNNPSGASIVHGTGTVVIGASDAGQASKPLISVGPDMVIGEGDGYRGRARDLVGTGADRRVGPAAHGAGHCASVRSARSRLRGDGRDDDVRAG